MELTRPHHLALTVMILMILASGCSERNLSELEIARATIDPVVFDDDYSEDVYFQPFSGTYETAVSLDSIYAFAGAKSLKITVPPQGSALGAYAGGVLTSAGSRDQADFNALTFYARSSVESFLDVAGFGNDNTGTSPYEAGRLNIHLTTDWTFVVVPIPSPTKLIAERGMFTFAESAEAPPGHEIWLDEIRFAQLDNITNPQPDISSVSGQYFVGTTAKLEGTYTNFDVDGAPVRVEHQPSYLDFEFSNPSVASLKGDLVQITGAGKTAISAKLDGVEAFGSDSLTGYYPPSGPPQAPTLPAEKVISLFSDVYNDVHVDTFNPYWGGTTTKLDDYAIDGDNMKLYSDLNYVAIVFTSQKIDASAMTHLHLDVYAPEGTNFRVKIVAFGSADDNHSDQEPELQFDADSTPAFVAEEWSPLEIPLADFQLAVSWEFIGMIIISSSDAKLVLVDNIYWHN